MTQTSAADAAAAALRQRFLAGMGQAACTVNVVTTDGASGRAGATVSAMSSVSADGDHPTLLVCVHHLSPVAAAVLGNGVFCVNVLRDSQAHISDVFSGRIKNGAGDKFAGTPWQAGGTGCPQIAGALVSFDCRLLQQVRVGTHLIFIGAVQDLTVDESGQPLIYAKRAYGTPAPLACAA
jgi:flavin reductase (DIM6/NTAB) family NADH-FMN oxidoreductase RutF